MKNVLLSIKKDNEKLLIYLLGIKIKFSNKYKKIDDRLNICERMIQDIYYGSRFVYTHGNNFSTSEFKRICADKFYHLMGYYPNLNNPQTFNEKINWLKYHYHNPVENYCCDKYTAKKYFSDKVGPRYVVPLLGMWEDVNDIDFDKLPNQVVFKNTLSGGHTGVKIVKDLSREPIDKLKYELNKLLFEWKNDGYSAGIMPKRKLIKERLIAEKYLAEIDSGIGDYKFFCFHGKPKFLYVAAYDEQNNCTMLFYDLDWNIQPFYNVFYKPIEKNIPKPKNFEKMIEIAEKLAQDFPFVRVDLYNIDGEIYVGELTFNPTGGFIKFNEKKYDYELGEMLDLTKIDKKHLTNDIVKTLTQSSIEAHQGGGGDTC